MSSSRPALPFDALALLAILFPMTFLRSSYWAAHSFVLPTNTIWFFSYLAYALGVLYLLAAYFGNHRDSRGVRLLIFALLVADLVIAPTLAAVSLRIRSGELHRYVHDNPIQVEEAVRFLLRGVNPYAVDYVDTPMGRWPYTGPMWSYDPDAAPPANWDVNPALFHVVSLPFGLLVVAPLVAAFDVTLGWFDARIAYLLAYLLALWLAGLLVRDPERRLALLIIIGLNPLLVSFLVEGRNDILVFSLVLACAVAWQRGRLDLAAVLLGLAMTTKHVAILFLPFFALLGWAQWGPLRARVVALARHLAPTALAALLVLLPFVAWDWRAFYEDTVGYLAGTLPTSYPLSGLGISGLAVFWGWVPNSAVPFPNALLQLVIAGPLLVALLWRQLRTNTIRHALAGYGLFLLVYMWLARIYFDNYVGYIVMVLSTAALWPTDDERSAPTEGE